MYPNTYPNNAHRCLRHVHPHNRLHVVAQTVLGPCERQHGCHVAILRDVVRHFAGPLRQVMDCVHAARDRGRICALIHRLCSLPQTGDPLRRLCALFFICLCGLAGGGAGTTSCRCLLYGGHGRIKLRSHNRVQEIKTRMKTRTGRHMIVDADGNVQKPRLLGTAGACIGSVRTDRQVVVKVHGMAVERGRQVHGKLQLEGE